jgi:NitT/TauT family transport system substrate-binding protein
MNDRFSLSRRRLLAGSLAAAGTAVTGGLVSMDASAADLPTVNLQVGYTAGGDQIAEVAAKHMGYFKDEGIDLAIQPGGPSVDGLAIVASGRFPIGQISSSPAIMMASSQGVPVRCFAVGLQRHPYAYFSLKQNPVRTPQDMIGKRIGVPPTGVVLLRLLLAKNGIPESKVTVVPLGGDMSPLLTGRVDVVTNWLTDVPALKVLGPDRVDLSLWDAGIHLYAWPYYATQSTLAAHPDMLVKFVRATARGWHFCKTQPDQAVDFLLKEYPQLNRNDERAALGITLTYALDDETRSNGWGTMTAERWQQQITQFEQLGQFTAHVPTVGDLMTTAILDQTRAVRMAV